jgi:hypothetical protein
MPPLSTKPTTEGKTAVPSLLSNRVARRPPIDAAGQGGATSPALAEFVKMDKGFHPAGHRSALQAGPSLGAFHYTHHRRSKP